MSGNTFYAGGNDEQQEDFGFSGSFVKKHPIITDGITKTKSMNINITTLLNIDESKLKNLICDDLDEIEDDWEHKLTYDEDKTQHDRELKTDNNDKDILTDDTEELKLGKTSSHIEKEDPHKNMIKDIGWMMMITRILMKEIRYD